MGEGSGRETDLWRFAENPSESNAAEGGSSFAGFGQGDGSGAGMAKARTARRWGLRSGDQGRGAVTLWAVFRSRFTQKASLLPSSGFFTTTIWTTYPNSAKADVR